MDKHCNGCNENKPVVDFHKDRTTPDGFQGRCKNCARVYRTNHRSEEAASSRKYHSQHKEEEARAEPEPRRVAENESLGLWDTRSVLDDDERAALYDDLAEFSRLRRAAKATAGEVFLSS